MNLGVKKSISLGDGRTISVETGKLAKQSHGSVEVRMGGTVILAHVVSNYDARADMDFMPLTIDYREQYASTGRFPGGFLKREARPSDAEILTMRLVDRALRPLFPDDYHGDTQVMIQLVSSDKVDAPDALACFAASAALQCSDIPIAEAVSEVRIGRIDGKMILNPTIEQIAECDLNIIVAATMDNIMMVEGEFAECSEADMLEAIKAAHGAIKQQCQLQLDLAADFGKKPTRDYKHENHNDELKAQILELAYQKCYDVAKQGLADKYKRAELFGAVKDEVMAELSDEVKAEWAFQIKGYFKSAQKTAVRRVVLDERIRLDGREMNQIRPIWSEVNYLPGPHGSAVFTRGETQSLTSVTLGGKMDKQLLDGAMFKGESDFLLHYNFPPFSTGEARPIRGVSRREIGHGNLALRALRGMLPEKEVCPYTIRIVSDILESNGSSSMATVCAGTLALLDAGIPLKKSVSGIAMGLIADDQGKYAVLSDILGDEDHLGDMDFKVTGTVDGITACQMDIKVDGLSYDILEEALLQAREGRLHILGEMAKTMSAPREDYKEHVPRMESFTVPNDCIGAIIGPGGKVIQDIQKRTETMITIEELEDGQGMVQISSADAEKMRAAVSEIKTIAFPPSAEVGEIYEGKVKSIMPYGAFVEVVPGVDGLLHISEIEWGRLDKVEDALSEGDVVKFKVLSKDPKTKKLKLSRKVLLPKPETAEKAE
ncbi:MAG: polyribonucleotide nucleotidyltransferase [Parvicellaceae bacterium]|jgi:polyribonucleotide nucleotidyltransferase